MKRIFSVILIFGMLSIFSFTGCDEKLQAKSDDKTPSTTAEVGKIDNPEVDNSEQTATPEAEIMLDKTYFNKRFKFEVKYPSIWSLVEEEDNPSFPDQGVFIFIENNNGSSIDLHNVNKIDHIKIFGQISPINIPEVGMTIGEFVTDEGVKATTYSHNVNGMLNTYYVLEVTDTTFGYGARVCVSENTNGNYSDIISKILKSIKLTPK